MPESEHPQDAPEAWMQSGFEALAAHLAILDARGVIMAVNEAWEQFGHMNDAPPMDRTGVGLNYLDGVSAGRRRREHRGP